MVYTMDTYLSKGDIIGVTSKIEKPDSKYKMVLQRKKNGIFLIILSVYYLFRKPY